LVKVTEFLEEGIASIFRVERKAKQDISKNRRRVHPEDGGYTFFRNVGGQIHGVITQKAELLIELRKSNQTQTPMKKGTETAMGKMKRTSEDVSSSSA
jgi:hypothetical protein